MYTPNQPGRYLRVMGQFWPRGRAGHFLFNWWPGMPVPLDLGGFSRMSGGRLAFQTGKEAFFPLLVFCCFLSPILVSLFLALSQRVPLGWGSIPVPNARLGSSPSFIIISGSPPRTVLKFSFISGGSPPGGCLVGPFIFMVFTFFYWQSFC